MRPKITAPDTNELTSLLKSEIKDALGSMDKFVTVGIHEDKNARKDMFSNAQVGAANHFGTSRIPARPFLDVGVEMGTNKYLRIIKSAAENNEPLDLALERCGIVAAGEVQKYIRELQDPPNAESTIKKKKSANPLIDTGQLRQSISYKVTSTKPSEGI